jgi:rod shape determining protein RodA
MMNLATLEGEQRRNDSWVSVQFQRIHLDLPLLAMLMVLAAVGLLVLYSAGDNNTDLLMRQCIRLLVAFGAMFMLAQVPPSIFRRYSAAVWVVTVLLLIAVLFVGSKGGGAQRWLDLGVVKFQPSELMKLTLPLVTAAWLASRSNPPSFRSVLISLALIAIPVLLIARQPDLGTSILMGASGIFVLFLAGLGWRWIFGGMGLVAAALPALWYVMKDYQRQRVLTLLNPEADPFGAGYHIIQSKIAIGSGGFWGKGWLNGTQSHLDFLPERSTDFIFAVLAEEHGLMGVIPLLVLYLAIVFRCLYIAAQATNLFNRTVAGSIGLTFFVYVFVNIGMVSGLLPVVGVPLPLVSYGGTSMVTLMAGFGILMSIHTHRKLIAR